MVIRSICNPTKNSKYVIMKIKAYLKPQCGWSTIRAIMDKYSLSFEDLDIINNQHIYAEMVEKSGQPLSPCVEVDGVMLADVSGEEVENYLITNKLVKESIPKLMYQLILLAHTKSMNGNAKKQTRHLHSVFLTIYQYLP